MAPFFIVIVAGRRATARAVEQESSRLQRLLRLQGNVGRHDRLVGDDLGGRKNPAVDHDLLQLRGPVRSTQRLDPILAELKPRPGQRVGAWLYQVGDYVISRFKYARDVTDASSPIDDLLRYGKGVCQDFAHLMLAICRANGVPARYISGYIHRPKKESQSHAWCEIWLPDLGWVGFDPTNGCPATERFVKP